MSSQSKDHSRWKKSSSGSKPASGSKPTSRAKPSKTKPFKDAKVRKCKRYAEGEKEAITRCYVSGMTYKQIHAVYPNRTVRAIQLMVHRAAKAGELTLRRPPRWWGLADQALLERVYRHRAIDRASIQAMYPSRQWSSLKRRLGEIPKRYHRQLSDYYRRRLVRHGAVRVHPGAWSSRAHRRGHRDACFLVTPRFLIRRTMANWLHRCLVDAEARDETVRLRLSHPQWGRRYKRSYRDHAYAYPAPS